MLNEVIEAFLDPLESAFGQGNAIFQRLQSVIPLYPFKKNRPQDAIRASLCLIGKFLEWVNSIAEQLNPETEWSTADELAPESTG